MVDSQASGVKIEIAPEKKAGKQTPNWTGAFQMSLEAPTEEYEKCGFSLSLSRDGTLTVGSELSSGELMISCSLNIGIWGPRGNFTLDPDEDGIVAHMPISGQPFVKPTNSRYRKFINHGKWFVDILYGLDRSSTNVVEANLGDNFKSFSRARGFACRKKIRPQNVQVQMAVQSESV